MLLFFCLPTYMIIKCWILSSHFKTFRRISERVQFPQLNWIYCSPATSRRRLIEYVLKRLYIVLPSNSNSSCSCYFKVKLFCFIHARQSNAWPLTSTCAALNVVVNYLQTNTSFPAVLQELINRCSTPTGLETSNAFGQPHQPRQMRGCSSIILTILLYYNS